MHWAMCYTMPSYSHIHLGTLTQTQTQTGPHSQTPGAVDTHTHTYAHSTQHHSSWIFAWICCSLMADWLRSGGRVAALLLPGCLLLDAAGGRAALSDGCYCLPHLTAAPLPDGSRLWHPSSHSGHLCGDILKRIRLQAPVSSQVCCCSSCHKLIRFFWDFLLLGK